MKWSACSWISRNRLNRARDVQNKTLDVLTLHILSSSADWWGAAWGCDVTFCTSESVVKRYQKGESWDEPHFPSASGSKQPFLGNPFFFITENKNIECLFVRTRKERLGPFPCHRTPPDRDPPGPASVLVWHGCHPQFTSLDFSEISELKAKAFSVFRELLKLAEDDDGRGRKFAAFR